MMMTSIAFEKLFQEYQESGLSVHDFCANQDIAPSSFYYWRKKRLLLHEAPNEFVPLVLGHSPEKGNLKHYDQVPVLQQSNSVDTENIEFTYPNGTKVSLRGNADISLLKTIVHLY